MSRLRKYGKDPRKEKLLDYRHRGHSCSSPTCMFCKWDEMHKGSYRQERKRQANKEAEDQ